MEQVGPLRFGMNRDETEEALRGVAMRGVAVSAAPGLGGSVEFGSPDANLLDPSSILTTYYDTSGSLAGIAVDARNGPQVTLGEMRLVGRVPSELEEQFVQYLEARGRMVTYNQFWDFSCNVLGIVVRAQRVDDVVLSRPVFVASHWANRCGDACEGPVPNEEWQHR
ncbi:hypothetical protein OG936_10620 [Streptomyces sp. NBC_00846]|uniref:hypothetical protein n=1 Tax=Streptomyces sp. NBC_00846 TaxID=2975849 RepID=UPI00386AEEAB|nr:hypothetical protein OG936_10620 [Streptomyces sp. NBC_00846]